MRHVRGFFGYALRAYRMLYPNIAGWLRDRRPLFPAVLQVQTINRCNAACQMCPYPQTIAREPREVMSMELWRKIAEECAAEAGCHSVVPMAQNEPLLDPLLDERVAYFRERARPDQEIELVTNGASLDAARLERLGAHGVDLISISVSATDAVTYARIMGGLKWRRTLRNLASIRRHRSRQVNVFIRFIRQRDNASQARAFRRRWRRAGFNVLEYEINDRAGTVAHYTALREPPSLGRCFRAWLRRFFSRRIFPVCPHAFSIAHVLQNGAMPLCTNDWQHREVLGNVRQQRIRDIYNSPRAREIRELMRQGRYEEIAPCRTCSLWKDANWL